MENVSRHEEAAAGGGYFVRQDGYFKRQGNKDNFSASTTKPGGPTTATRWFYYSEWPKYVGYFGQPNKGSSRDEPKMVIETY